MDFFLKNKQTLLIALGIIALFLFIRGRQEAQRQYGWNQV